MLPLCKTMGSSTNKPDKLEEEDVQTSPKLTSVTDSIVKPVVVLPTPAADTDIPARDVVRPVTESKHVVKGTEVELFGMRPRCLHHNLWTPYTEPMVMATEWTLLADPLPRPPQSEFENLAAIQTITEHLELFEIISPMNVGVLEELTTAHPNRVFVRSVLEGLSNGFWPWASTVKEGYPLMWDESRCIQLSPEKEEFMRKQVKHEVSMGRMSHEFGMNILPGMYCMPNYVVPKPHTDDLRLVNDLSAGPYSLNSMVDHQSVVGYPMDNLSQLGELLLRNRDQNPGKRFVVWKSDVAEVYRICPMHILWQLKQALRVKGSLRIERVNVFGGSGSGAIFILLNALVAWIEKYKELIKCLIYMADSFGVEEEGVVERYEPYKEVYPAWQMQLLKLWDRIGIPHKEKKQLSGGTLMVLGVEVNVNNL